MNKVNLSEYQNALSRKNQIARYIWTIVWTIFARPIPRSMLNGWKIFLLKMFGAKIGKHSVVYSSATIFAPWNLILEEYVCIGPKVECYNPAPIIIGKHTTISQKTYLCAASHDISKSNIPLITGKIIIEDQVWVGADVFVGMNVTIKQGSVIGARSSVFKDIGPWTVVGGSPAKFIKRREIYD